MSEPKLPETVVFIGIRWTEHDRELAQMFSNWWDDDNWTPSAVADYTALDYWRVSIGWDEDFPRGGPGRLFVAAASEDAPSKVEGGIPSQVIRLLPLRHARWALSGAWAHRNLSQRVLPFLSDKYETDEEWARLAHAYVLLTEAGVRQVASTLAKIDPRAAIGVWNSRIQRLRDPKYKGFLAKLSDGSWAMTGAATVAFSRTVHWGSHAQPSTDAKSTA